MAAFVGADRQRALDLGQHLVGAGGQRLFDQREASRDGWILGLVFGTASSDVTVEDGGLSASSGWIGGGRVMRGRVGYYVGRNLLLTGEYGVWRRADAAADSVAEDAGVGVGVGVTAYAEDPDGGDTVTYSLDNDAGGLFAIDAGTGVVTVAGALDAETSTSHTITVRATSDDGSTATQSFTISVTDDDEFDIGPVTDVDPADNTITEDATDEIGRASTRERV